MRNKRLSIDSALDGDVLDARFTGYRIVFAIDFDDGGSVAPHRIVHFHLGVVMVTFGVKCDDGVGLTDLYVIAR